MIKHQVLNLLDAPVTHMAHQANCFHIMGGGIASAIRQRYPMAYEADLKTRKGDRAKLGTFSRSSTGDAPSKVIYNVYSQFNLSQGIGDRATQYDMVDIGLRAVLHDMAGHHTVFSTADEQLVLGLPYNYGCVLGGGSWRIVEAIIYDIFETSPVDVLLCEWPPKRT
jgi:O-acetyl-ADP-ribose deacetylase (regulator of RNase III)